MARHCVHADDYQPIDLPAGLMAHRLYVRAAEYLNAGKHLVDAAPELVQPAYFALCHGIELSLKAFLAARSVSRKEQSKLGHCLECLWSAAIVQGLSVDDASSAELMLCHLSEYTELHRYPDFIMQNRLVAIDVIGVAEKIYSACQSAVLIAAIDNLGVGRQQMVNCFSHAVQQ